MSYTVKIVQHAAQNESVYSLKISSKSTVGSVRKDCMKHFKWPQGTSAEPWFLYTENQELLGPDTALFSTVFPASRKSQRLTYRPEIRARPSSMINLLSSSSSSTTTTTVGSGSTGSMMSSSNPSPLPLTTSGASFSHSPSPPPSIAHPYSQGFEQHAGMSMNPPSFSPYSPYSTSSPSVVSSTSYSTLPPNFSASHSTSSVSSSGFVRSQSLPPFSVASRDVALYPELRDNYFFKLKILPPQKINDMDDLSGLPPVSLPMIPNIVAETEAILFGYETQISTQPSTEPLLEYLEKKINQIQIEEQERIMREIQSKNRPSPNPTPAPTPVHPSPPLYPPPPQPQIRIPSPTPSIPNYPVPTYTKPTPAPSYPSQPSLLASPLREDAYDQSILRDPAKESLFLSLLQYDLPPEAVGCGIEVWGNNQDSVRKFAALYQKVQHLAHPAIIKFSIKKSENDEGKTMFLLEKLGLLQSEDPDIDHRNVLRLIELFSGDFVQCAQFIRNRKSLRQMGFSIDAIEDCLIRSGNDLDKAATYLISASS